MKKINLNYERNILEGNILEPVNCNLCGSNDYKIIYSPQYDKVSQQELAEKFRSSGDELLIDQLVECKNCGLQYINPRIRADLILKGYSEGTDENFISQADSREKTFAQQLKYIETLMEKNSSKGKNSSIAKDNSSAKNNLTTKGKIYDIGTAGGSFLQAAKKRGWEVYGSEPNKWLCQWGKEHYGIERYK